MQFIAKLITGRAAFAAFLAATVEFAKHMGLPVPADFVSIANGVVDFVIIPTLTAITTHRAHMADKPHA